MGTMNAFRIITAEYSCDTALEGTTEENEEATTSTNRLIDEGVNSLYLLENSALDADTVEPLICL